MKRYSNVLSVPAGSVATFLMALILYPVVRIVFNKYFHIFEAGTKTDDLIISITLLLWALIASLAGGIVTTLIAKTSEWIYVFLSIILVFILLAIITRGEIFEDGTTDSILVIAMIPLGFLFGKLIGSLIKRKRREAKIQRLISNIPSSQTGTVEQ